MSCATETIQVLTVKSLLFLDTHLSTKHCQDLALFHQSGRYGSSETPEASLQLTDQFTFWNEAGTNQLLKYHACESVNAMSLASLRPLLRVSR